jgi:4-nitrophenyl phosphatase
MAALPTHVRLVILDLDGVIYRGHEAIPGAPELMRRLRAAGVAVRFATNNSTVTRAGYVERLAEMGVPVLAEEIVTSTTATIEYLRRHEPWVRSVIGVGADGMRDELAAAGYAVTMAGDLGDGALSGRPLAGYDAVLVGLDPQLDYGRLAAAMAAVAGGALIVATNADARYPTPDGFLPGAGSIVAALAAATGSTPDVIGKPSPAMFEAIMQAASVEPGETVVVGDNPDADVEGARRAGCAAILVLTGVASAQSVAALAGDRVPDAVASGPDDVWRLLADRIR